MHRALKVGIFFLGLLAVLGIAWSQTADKGAAKGKGAAKMAPRFEVDPFWPRPLPNH